MTRKILGMNVDRKDNGDFQIDQKQVNDYFTQEGVDKEIRKTIAKAEEKLMLASFEFLKPEVIKKKDKQRVLLGAGNGQMVCTLKGKTDAFAPPKEKGGERVPVTKYGSASVSIKRKIPGALKSKALNQIALDIEKALK